MKRLASAANATELQTPINADSFPTIRAYPQDAKLVQVTVTIAR